MLTRSEVQPLASRQAIGDFFRQSLGYPVNPVAFDTEDLGIPAAPARLIRDAELLCDYQKQFQVYRLEVASLRRTDLRAILEPFYRKHPAGNYLFVFTQDYRELAFVSPVRVPVVAQTVSLPDDARQSDKLRYRPHDFWCYYDLQTGRITERKLDLLKRIRCDEKTERVEPDFDVYDLIDRCKQHIVRRLKRQAVKPATLKAPQNQVVNWLQTQAGQTFVGSLVPVSQPANQPTNQPPGVGDLLTYLAEPLPSPLLKSLGKVWRGAFGDVPARLSALREFAAANPLAVAEMGNAKEAARLRADAVAEEELQLVCWMAVV